MLFPKTTVKPRRFKPYEMETEKWLASLFKRPVRTFITDTPFYPYLPPEPKVNFDLNYTH